MQLEVDHILVLVAVMGRGATGPRGQELVWVLAVVMLLIMDLLKVVLLQCSWRKDNGY